MKERHPLPPLHLSNSPGAADISLTITGGLRISSDFAKALALGADAVAINDLCTTNSEISNHTEIENV
jgi:isopentenyl diphosphate isomerase/L-lactate dehydrogenase-like FMN-dependent dehydrogenase